MGPTANFYQILEVSADANKADITSSYRRLCKLYHPDISKLPCAEEKMSMINVAYETLQDDVKRKAYDRDRQPFALRTRQTAPMAKPTAQKVINDYFNHLLKGSFEKAYNLLCINDRRYVSQQSFINWRKAVQDLYSMRCFTLQQEETISNFVLNEKNRVEASKFTIDVLEKDLTFGRLEHHCFSKYVVFEQGDPGVFLGYHDLNEIAKMFDDLARQREQSLMLKHWEEHVNTTDRHTGMLNREGLILQSKRELYRAQRYDRPLAIMCFCISPFVWLSESQKGEALDEITTILKSTLRQTDMTAYLGGGLFAVLLPELKKRHTQAVIENLLQKVEQTAGSIIKDEVSASYAYELYADGPLSRYLERLSAKIIN